MEEQELNLQLFFNSPEQNPYAGLMLTAKIAQRSRIIDDVLAGRADIVEMLVQLQNLDDVLIGELIQGHRLAEAWQAEAAKWKQQAETLQARFNQFQKTHF
jgi:hypothetical protein